MRFFKKTAVFTPDLNKTEYDNWLDFLSKGGTSEEWKKLKKKNNWKFKTNKADLSMKYEEEFRPIFRTYYTGVQQLKSDWSVMNKLDNYSGKQAERFEKECLKNIEAFKVMYSIEDKYGKDHLTMVEGYKRLAMLYEKQGRFEDSIAICKEAYSFGIDERSRMIRMIKKAGRTPTSEELALMEK